MQTNLILANFHNNLYPDNKVNRTNVAFKNSSQKPKEMSKSAKVGVFASTLAGVATAFLMLAKSHKLPPLTALKEMEYGNKEIMSLAAGSVTGGLIGGRL